MLELNVDELRDFGRAADQLRQPSLVEGGFLTLGHGCSPTAIQRKDKGGYVGQETRPEEAGSATGSREGRSTPSAPAGTTAHPIERGLSAVLELEELFAYHPDAQWVGSSSSSSMLAVPVGLFERLPYRATLLLEIPSTWPSWLLTRPVGYVPLIRAWAAWNSGIRIRAHHEYPDQSICACTEASWQLSRNPIEDYVSFCICWIAKVLHAQVLGRWPGKQHCGAAIRLKRNRPDEYCGCESDKLYGNCCMSSDVSRLPMDLASEFEVAQATYLGELRRRKLEPQPPPQFWQMIGAAASR